MGDETTHEIIYTYKEYKSTEESPNNTTLRISDIETIGKIMNTTKYFFSERSKDNKRVFFGLIWNEETIDDTKTFSDVYFVNVAIQRKLPEDINQITSCHIYKCNTESANIHFGYKRNEGYSLTDYCGFFTEKEVGDTTAQKVLFGFQNMNNDNSSFVIPPKSFFIEGEHQNFFVLEPGSYAITSTMSNF